jgi:hypothetical protein
MEDQLGIWLRTRLDIQLLQETNRLAEFADISMYWPGGEEGEIMDLMHDSHDHRWEDFGNRQHRSHRYLAPQGSCCMPAFCGGQLIIIHS